MKTEFSKDSITRAKTNAIVIPCWEDETTNDYIMQCNDALQLEYKRLQKNKIFTAKQLTSYTLSTLGNMPASNLILIGLGKKDKFASKHLRRAVHISHKLAKSLKSDTYMTLLNQVICTDLEDVNKISALVAETTVLSNYEFSRFMTSNKNEKKEIKKVYLFNNQSVDSNTKRAVEAAIIVANATCYSRDLVNSPPNEVYPEVLANEARKLRSSSTKVTVFDEKKLKRMGANGILAVGMGSIRKPRLIIMDYYPRGAKNSIAIVGKGITFDSGGLNIKPGPYMETMKCDMSGAAAVLGIIKACQKLKIKQRVFGVIGSAENMPSGQSYRPDDIIRMYSGKTVEVGNTDAEGRVVLGDALAYTEKKLKPNKIVDFATLTGACVVALGYQTAALMTTNDDLANSLIKAGEKSDDLVWRLPFFEEYKEKIKSAVADVKNISTSRGAGSITAGHFLGHFVEKTPWAHIDIAGTAFLKESQWYKPKGGTGAGVRLIMKYLQEQNN